MGNKKDMYDLLDEEIAALDISEEQRKALKNLSYVNKKHLVESIKQNQQREKTNILLERAKETINDFEGMTDYFYLDSKGNKTIAKGRKVNDKPSFMQIDTITDGKPATLKEKENAFNLYEQLIAERKYGQNYRARDYENVSPLRISKETADELMTEHLQNDVKRLQKTFPEFNNFPLPLQEVLVDIHYNTGNVSPSNWPNLHRGIKNRDLSLIAKNIHRKDVQKERNDWALERIKSIGSW